ncbi:MAG: carbohydrate kinase family protein [Oscillospiraceae bacterium]|nr:carbohydrate kinase family protein [Oscillospiraceae bacterium]
MFDVIGIESPCMDFTMNLDKLPTSNTGARLNAYTWQGGGKVSTGTIAAARLGAKCMQIGTLGDDVFGRSVYADIVRHGIDVSRMQIVPGTTTSLAVVMCDLETGGRSIMFKPGNAPRVREDESLDVEAVRDAKFFFLAYLGGANLRAARIARESGAQVLMDANNLRPGLLENIGLVDYFIASEFVYKAMFPESTDYKASCAEVLKMGPHTVVFTFGPKGCVGMDGSGFFELPAYKVPVVDTLGAGDVYHGAFLAGLLRGWDAKKTADFSNAVSAIKCTRPGGRAGIPDFETAMRFIETGEIDYTDIDKRVEYYSRGLEHI